MKNRERFENATQFLAGYFNLDWHEDFKEPEEAAAQYIKDADAERRAAALRDLRQIIAEFPEPQLNRVMPEICCFYSPERYRGMTLRAWLDQVIAEIEESLGT